MKKIIAATSILCFLLPSLIAQSQAKKVLFLGNSYTYFNNLPELFQNLSLATGDSVTIDSNTPGGYTLEQHASNTTSQSKIMQGDLDFVILQDQSQRPSFPIGQVQTEVFPYAKQLVDMVKNNNPCGQAVFYMTWGRENGDALNCNSWPPVCTYEGMDSLLALRYNQMADDNDALVSPVGAAWRYIRTNHPNINLYNADGSHPSLEGSYLAACCFYTVIHRKDPALANFNSTLSPTEAQILRDAASVVVYDSLSKWNVGNFDPMANFTFSVTDSVVAFTNSSTNADVYLWDFGDGDTTSSLNPTHTFSLNGTYTVRLISEKCGRSDTSQQDVIIDVSTALDRGWPDDLQLFPNPAHDYLFVEGCSVKAVEIMGLDGKKVRTELKQVGCDWEVKVGHLPAGVYLIRVHDKDSSYSRKWLKN